MNTFDLAEGYTTCSSLPLACLSWNENQRFPLYSIYLWLFLVLIESTEWGIQIRFSCGDIWESIFEVTCRNWMLILLPYLCSLPCLKTLTNLILFFKREKNLFFPPQESLQGMDGHEPLGDSENGKPLETLEVLPDLTEVIRRPAKETEGPWFSSSLFPAGKKVVKAKAPVTSLRFSPLCLESLEKTMKE